MKALPLCVSGLIIVAGAGLQAQRGGAPAQRPAASASGPAVKPGSLLSMSTDTVSQVLGSAKGARALPRIVGETTIVTCRYQPARPGAARDVRHFWYGENPTWLNGLPATNPARRLASTAATECPATLALADAKNNPPAAPAEPPKPVAPPPPPRPTLTSSSFVTTGLSNEKVFSDLFRGDFVDIKFDRENMFFIQLLDQYLDAYAHQCSADLPPNKVEIGKAVCTKEDFPVNKSGARIGAATCSQYKMQGTGLYADPNLYDAKNKLYTVVAANGFRDAMRAMNQSNAAEVAKKMADDSQSITADMKTLLQKNSCSSPGLRRFQDNVMRFALSQPPLLLTGSEGGQ